MTCGTYELCTSDLVYLKICTGLYRATCLHSLLTMACIVYVSMYLCDGMRNELLG